MIEPGDKENYYDGMHKIRGFERTDVADRTLYITIRDMVEQKIASGQKAFTIEYTTHDTKASIVGDNLLVDVKKAYPQHNTTGSDVFYTVITEIEM